MEEMVIELGITALIYVGKFLYFIFTSVVQRITNIYGKFTKLFGKRSNQSDYEADEEYETKRSKSKKKRRYKEDKQQEEDQKAYYTGYTYQQTDIKDEPAKYESTAKKALNKGASPVVASKSTMALVGWLIVSIPQGSIGLTKTLGVLSPEIMQPGIHLTIPAVQQVYTVKTTVETHTIKNIPCGTSTGVLLRFEKVEVVSKLKVELAYETVKNYSSSYNEMFIEDKVHYLVNKFCSKYSVRQVSVDYFDKMDEWLIKALKEDNRPWAPGIYIISLRITKPEIPESIRSNYEQVYKMKVEYMIQSERQKVCELVMYVLVERQATVHKEETIKAQSTLEVKLIELNKTIELRENEYRMQLIEAEIYLDRKNTETDNDYLIYEKNVEADLMRLNGPFLRAYGRECLSSNVTFKLGDYIPTIAA